MLKAFGVNKSKPAVEYDASLLTLNYRMNEISAAIGIEQIKRRKYRHSPKITIITYYQKL